MSKEKAIGVTFLVVFAMIIILCIVGIFTVKTEMGRSEFVYSNEDTVCVSLNYIEDLQDGSYTILDKDDGLLLASGDTRYLVDNILWNDENNEIKFWKYLSEGDSIVIKDGKCSSECVKY